MKLRNRISFLTQSREGQPPRRVAPKFTQGLYILVLLGIFGYVAYYVGYQWLFFDIRGQLETQDLTLAAQRSGRLTEMKVQPGAHVKEGDLLALVKGQHRWRKRSRQPIRQLRREAQIANTKMTQLRKQIGRFQAKLEELQLKRAIELDIRSRRRQLEEKLTKLRSELAITKQERHMARQSAAQAKKEIASADLQPVERIKAPFDGTIEQIHFAPEQVVPANEAILSLRKVKPEVRVVAYLDTKSADSVELRKEVTVVLPGGSATSGEIAAIGSSAQPFPKRKWDVYRLEPTDVRIRVAPANQRVASRWRKFDRMDVEVRGSR